MIVFILILILLGILLFLFLGILGIDPASLHA